MQSRENPMKPLEKKEKSICVKCHGSQICEHSKIKYQCIDCGGKRICIHKKRKSHCKECINAYNRENRKEYDREYRLNNKEKKSEAVKKCHSNKKEYYLNYAKEYYKKNKKEIQKTKNKYIKTRLLVDSLFVTSTKISLV